jgi:hypothetical protein
LKAPTWGAYSEPREADIWQAFARSTSVVVVDVGVTVEPLRSQVFARPAWFSSRVVGSGLHSVGVIPQIAA